MSGIILGLEVAAGFSTGLQCASSEKAENEVKQGKTPTSDYLASIFQSNQIGTFSNVAGRVLRLTPPTPLLRSLRVANGVMPFLSIVACPTTTALNKGHIREVTEVFKTITFNKLPLDKVPQELSPKTKRFFKFFADHTGTIARVGTFSGAVALSLFGSPVFGTSVLAPLVYREADRHGYVPKKMSLVFERYMPAVTNVGLLASGNLFLSGIAGMNLASQSPRVSRAIHHRLDNMACRQLELPGPTLEEVDAPFVLPPDLTFEQILNVINSENDLWEINPPALSFAAIGQLNLAQDLAFEKYLIFFKSVNWIERHALIRGAYKDDDRFLEWLVETLNERSKAEKTPESKLKIFTEEDVKKNFSSHINALAEEAKKSPAEFFADYLETKMGCLIAILKGECKFQGSEEDRSECINRCAMILSFLSTLNVDIREDKVCLEGILLKLAVEGGDYCVRGIKRAAGEILDEISYRGMSATDYDPIKDYEHKIRQGLESQRCRIFQNMYQKFIEHIVLTSKKGIMNNLSMEKQTTDSHAVAIAQDVHAMDIYRLCFAVGFLPLTKAERNSFSFPQLYLWSTSFRMLRSIMCKITIDSTAEVFEEKGATIFNEYIARIIHSNPHLSSEQKEEILGLQATEDVSKFYRLTLVKMGFLRRIGWDDWIEVTDVPEDADWTHLEAPERDLESGVA